MLAALKLKKSTFCIDHIYVPHVLMAFAKKISLVDGLFCEEELNSFEF